MKATVISISAENGAVRAIVCRNHKSEGVYCSKFGDNDDLKVGDKIEVTRQINNPYLVRVK